MAINKGFCTKILGDLDFEGMIPPDPQQVNELAEKILEEILNHPEKKMIQGELQRFGNVVDIYEPSGRGARYSAAGEFIGFLE